MEKICLNLVKIKNKKLVSRLRTAAMAAECKVIDKERKREIFFIHEGWRLRTILIVKEGKNYYYDTIRGILSPLWVRGGLIDCKDENNDENGEVIRLHLTLD